MSSLIIREFGHGDITAIQPMLERWVRDRNTGQVLTEEIAEDMATLAASAKGDNPPRLLVAEEEGRVLGIMGLQPPTEQMLRFATTEHPTELTFALVSDDARRKGVGLALVGALTRRALSEGSTEFVVASSECYQESGWPFWEKLFGEPVDMIKEFNSGGDAKVWRKSLN